ncbi:fumarylacetoacetate hydrolase family protein [Hoeflea sp. WL0058]|uniref:Fumarylacetoacetate hydrolase family protein n=1 Tax=Flavimaribacter sediminis TaxID=2865987 RepID=A0AAE3D138_9HYPH|nr:fumarylacetoacetate hydrolase family protein [Flavimaribacter sediminis]MBW8638454.1 fumarylacetoacetate hydrolase family protein [Flavimaribacter sediminis]
MAGYRLVTYFNNEHHRKAGVLSGDTIYAASDLLGGDPDVLDILRDWESSQSAIEAVLGEAGSGAPPAGRLALSDVTLETPVQYPANFFCAGANYWDHLKEMAEFVKKMTGSAPSMEKAPEPWFFVKTTAGTLVGDGANVPIPSFSSQLDWEAELGVVIGRPVRNIPEADALSAIAGYVIINDLSARDLMRREGSPFVYDWIGQKCFDGAAPCGPWLTPAKFVPDPENLEITLKVNGVTRQHSNTGQMVHSLAEQIAYLSRHVTLNPGDLIATGTPAGVGMPKGEFLQPGDEVEIAISELGVLRHTMIAA